MATITLGTNQQFEAGATSFIAVARLSSSDAFVCYQDEGDSYRGKGVLLDLTASPPTVNTPNNYSAAGNIDRNIYTAVCRLTDTTGLVVYGPRVSGTYGCVVKHVTAGASSLSYGIIQTIHATDFCYADVTRLTDTKAICVYRPADASNVLRGVILDISGTSITVNSYVTIESGTSNLDCKVVRLADDKAAIVYTDGPGNLLARVLSSITTTFTVSAATTLESTDQLLDEFRMDAVPYGSSSCFVAWWGDDGAGNDRLKGIAFSVSGTTISEGTAVTFKTNASASNYSHPNVATLGSSNIAIAHANSSSGDDGEIFSVSLSGTAITDNDDEQAFDTSLGTGDLTYISIDDNSSGDPVLCYADQGGSRDGRVIAVGVVTGANAKFYQGSNALAYKSDLTASITTVHPGALLVRQSGLVVVGAGVANDPAIITATSTDDYAAWTDITGTHPVNGEITSVIEVKR